MARRLKVGILDLVAKEPGAGLYSRVMNANLASIMPQVIGTWCREDGHDVTFVCYTGFEELLTELPEDADERPEVLAAVMLRRFRRALRTAVDVGAGLRVSWQVDE